MRGRELFVWYRVRRDDAERARRAVTAAQAALRRDWPGLEARLLVRDDGDPQTWMETYARPSSGQDGGRGIDRKVEAAIAAAAGATDGLTDGPRHVEAFVALA